jgi:hypothetical protein
LRDKVGERSGDRKLFLTVSGEPVLTPLLPDQPASLKALEGSKDRAVTHLSGERGPVRVAPHQ